MTVSQFRCVGPEAADGKLQLDAGRGRGGPGELADLDGDAAAFCA